MRPGSRPVTDHVLPFQRSDLVPAIATQNLGDSHQIAPSGSFTCRAVFIADQRDPFQRSVGVPVITQNRRDTHDTLLAITVRLGSSRTDQFEPFHIPLIHRKAPVKVDEYTTIPRATQNRGDPHETEVHSLWPPAGDETGSIDHETPSQCSARTVPDPPDAPSTPTAVQAEGDVHETASSAPSAGDATSRKPVVADPASCEDRAGLRLSSVELAAPAADTPATNTTTSKPAKPRNPRASHTRLRRDGPIG